MITDAEQKSGPGCKIIGFLGDTDDPLKGKKAFRAVVGTIRDYFPSPNDALLMCIAPHETKARSHVKKGVLF